MIRRVALLVLLVFYDGASAWVMPTRRTRLTHNNGHSITCSRGTSQGPRIARNIPLYIKADADKDEQDTAERASKLFKSFVRSLGKGILFAKPFSPTVAHALFGIKRKRKNEVKGENSPSTISFTLRQGLVSIGIYLSVGIVAYSLLVEHWSLIDAIYFSVTLFTTVGYGDLLPQTRRSKIFTCLFSLGGIAFLAAALASIGANLVETELKAARVAKKLSQRRAMKGFGNMIGSRNHTKNLGNDNICTTITAVVPFNATTAVTAVVPFNATTAVTATAGEITPPPPPAKLKLHNIVAAIIPRFLIIAAGGLALGRIEGWSRLDSVYFGMITASTIGFGGELAPSTQKARLLAVLFIPLAVAAGGEVLGTIASAFLQRRRTELFENMMTKDFTMDHIKAMDNDGDGEVSRLDYMEFMLVEMQLVEKGVLEELNQQFDRLDLNTSGSLTKEDLILMAKLRRRRQEQQQQAQTVPST